MHSESLFCLGIMDVAAGLPARQFQFEEIIEAQPFFRRRDCAERIRGGWAPDAAQVVDIHKETAVRGRFAWETLGIGEDKGVIGGLDIDAVEWWEEPFRRRLIEEGREGDGITHIRGGSPKPREEGSEGGKGI